MENEELQNSPPQEETKAPETKEPEKQPVAEKRYSDADLDKIISQKFAKWQAAKQKELDEAGKLAEMNAQQKVEYERDRLRQQLELLQREKTHNEMAKTARGMLSESGTQAGDELLACLVSGGASAKQRDAVPPVAENLFCLRPAERGRKLHVPKAGIDLAERLIESEGY